MDTTKTKEKITLQEFQVLRLNFLRERHERYAAAQDLTWEQVQDRHEHNPDFYKEVDSVVDEQFHSSNTPKEEDFDIV